MSLKKKDPALRVAANDPHLVSLGGGRLSTAVTIHYIPIGDMTIGSSPTCSISLNGSGVRPVHCTIYRSEENEVTIVPEPEARILIDGTKLSGETNLTQGAMITIGNSNYLRFNNPAEAQLIRSAMGSNERISMPQIDFTQVPRRNSGRSSSNGSEEAQIEAFYESKIHPKECKLIEDIDINGLTCPKVFTADSVTVNTPAKDVLGPKYANFAKNLAEIHRNNEKNQKMNNYVNIPAAGFQHQHNLNLNSSSSSINGSGNEILQKVNNNFSNNRNTTPYDRYPKSQGGLQLFPMNGVNNEINTSSPAYRSESPASNNSSQHNITAHESERLEEILKICTEYDRQNQSSVSSSPIVQNRIKTNGSLPREKKGPFYEHSPQHTGSSKTFFQEKAKGGTGYENVRILSDRRVEIGGGVGSGGGTGGGVGGGGGSVIGSPKSGYENVIVGRYTPQSPRTKIRTTCMSPKKDSSYNNSIFHSQQQNNLVTQPQQQTSTTDYEQLIQTFEDKLKMEMEAIQDSSRLASPPASVVDSSSPSKRVNKNINNLTLDLSLVEKEKEKEKQKPVPAVRTVKTNMTVPVATSSEFVGDIDKLKKTRKKLLIDIQSLKTQISELQRQEDETLREMDMEKALVTAEVTSIKKLLSELEASFTALQTKIHRLEAQRNAARVMEENQQAKLKQTIAIKQDQTKRLNQMLKEKPLDECLKEEFEKCSESLENDRKTFEDLEFQYLEEETEWQAYREELHMEQKDLSSQIDEKRTELRHLENQEAANHNSASSDARALKSNLILLVNELRTNQEQLRALETNIADITGELNGYSDPSSEDDRCDDDDGDVSAASPEEIQHGIMSQSLFGSAELLCPKRHTEDIMSKSVNENMFYNNKIEILSQQPATSTPKRQLKAVNIDDDLINAPPPALPPKSNRNSEDLPSIEDKVVRRLQREETDPLLKLKYNVNDEETQERVNFNLSLGSDDFEVNPLERRIPSQDDIDRICKVTSDAPISTKGASNKIFDSIKEIERNRQLLLAQQGCHVIEHERQKMLDLKKKSHDEARAQYLSMLSTSLDNSTSNKNVTASPETDNLNDKENHHHHHQQLPQQQVEDADKKISSSTDGKQSSGTNKHTTNGESSSNDQSKSSQNRHSQPELESQRSRPLSDANSELSCDLLSENTYKSSIELSSSCGNGGSGGSAGGGGGANCNGGGNRHSEQSDDGKRSSVNSNDTTSSDRLISGSKRMLPKHQRPLTRYLPISSPDLDLRLHIESAGHQIAQCPHVFVDSYSCRGYLHKLGATFHGWSRRWFVLDRERSAFIYYSDKSERKPRGGAYFSTIDEVYLDHLNASKSGRPHCTFIVKTKKRSYHLQASSDAAARIWIDAIITGAQGNLDY